MCTLISKMSTSTNRRQRLGTALILETDALLVNLIGIERWEPLAQGIEEVTVFRWETVVASSLKAINKVDPEMHLSFNPQVILIGTVVSKE